MTRGIAELHESYRRISLIELRHYRYLLRLLVRKELHVRYQGSVVGIAWSYIKPAVQFLVFYFAVGVFLGMRDVVDNFAVYLFSGIIVINFLTEAIGNATRAVVANAPLVKKVFLPRQLFPLASVLVAAVHFLPQVLVLVVGALLTGWRPDAIALLAGLTGFLVAVITAVGVGLLAGALNVTFRDTENLVDLVLMVLPWAAPVLYTWQHVEEVLGDSIWWWLYHLNPVTVAVELFHQAFWAPSVIGAEPPTQLVQLSVIAVAVATVLLVIGQLIFTRRDQEFAQVL